MTLASPPYVSPNLAPTSEWANQTSTGVFRPPRATHDPAQPTRGSPSLFGDKTFEGPLDSRQSYLLPASTAQKATERALAAAGEGLAGYPAARVSSSGTYESREFSATSPMNGPTTGGIPLPMPLSMPLASSPHDSLLPLMRAIRQSVYAEQDAFMAQKESNRVLEAELQREQELRRATSNHAATLAKSIGVLRELVAEQEKAIAAVRASATTLKT